LANALKRLDHQSNPKSGNHGKLERSAQTECSLRKPPQTVKAAHGVASQESVSQHDKKVRKMLVPEILLQKTFHDCEKGLFLDVKFLLLLAIFSSKEGPAMKV
jgi:hypothetical protein